MWQSVPEEILEDAERERVAKQWADEQRAVAAKIWADDQRRRTEELVASYQSAGPGQIGLEQGPVEPAPDPVRQTVDYLSTLQNEATQETILSDVDAETGISAPPSSLGVSRPETGEFQGQTASQGIPATPEEEPGLLGRLGAGVRAAGETIGRGVQAVGEAVDTVGVGLQEGVKQLPGGEAAVDWMQEQGRENLARRERSWAATETAMNPKADPAARAAARQAMFEADLPMVMDVSGGPLAKVGAKAVGAALQGGVGGGATAKIARLTEPAQAASTLYDKLSVVRFAGMLSGTATHLVNTAANTVSGVMDLPLKAAQAGVDVGRVGVGRALGQDVARTRYFAEIGPQVKGYAAGFWTGMKEVPDILAGKEVPGAALSKYDTRRLASGSEFVDTAVELPLRALGASDAIFRGAAFGGHSAALAVRKATQEGLSGTARAARAEEIIADLGAHPDILNGANKLAARSVFQEARTEVKMASELRHTNVGTRAFFDVVMPFMRTPYNVAAQGAGMTPAGYAGAIKAALDGHTGEAIDRAVRATVGTAAIYAGVQMAGGGFLTGAYPEDPSERSTLPEGWKPYSIRIPQGDGAIYVPITTLGALAVPLGVAANLHKAFKRGADEQSLTDSITKAAASTGKYMMDMSALQGFSAIGKLVTEPERAAEAFSESLAGSAVPFSGLMRQVQQGLGDAQRDPHGPVEAFMAAIPGLSENVRTKQTPLGEDRERGPSGLIAMVTGSRVGVEKPDTVLAALRDTGVGIPEPPKTVSTEMTKNIPLTEAERRDFRRIAGEEISKRVRHYTEHPAWATSKPEKRAEKMEKAIRDAREATRAKLLKQIGKDEAKRRVKATKVVGG